MDTKRDSLLDGAGTTSIVLKKYKTADGFYDTLRDAAKAMPLEHLKRHIYSEEAHVYVREDKGFSASYIPVTGEGEFSVLKIILTERSMEHRPSYETSYEALHVGGSCEYKTLAEAVGSLTSMQLEQHLTGAATYLYEIHRDMGGTPVRRINVFSEAAKDLIKEELRKRHADKLVAYIARDEEELYFLSRHLRDFPLTGSIGDVKVSIDPSVQSLTTFLATRTYLESLNLTMYGDIEDAYRWLLSVHHRISNTVDAIREIKHGLNPPAPPGGTYFKHPTKSMMDDLDRKEFRSFKEAAWDDYTATHFKELSMREREEWLGVEDILTRPLPEGGIELSAPDAPTGGGTPPP